MPDTDPIPVIDETAPPVLSYANLRGQQPGDSRFVCEVLPDGVQLNEEPLPTAGRLDFFVGILLTGLGVFLVVAMLVSGWREWGSSLIPAFFLCVVGPALIRQSRIFRTQPTRFLVTKGKLEVWAPTLSRIHRQWELKPSLKIKCVNNSIGFQVGRRRWGRMGTVQVQTRSLSLSEVILTNHPQDECEWIARELTSAIERELQARRDERSRTMDIAQARRPGIEQ